MIHSPVIDLLCFAPVQNAAGYSAFRQVISLSRSVSEFNTIVRQYLDTTDADWVLFWDNNLGLPDTVLISRLMNTPADVYHAGLRLGLTGIPEVLNYVQPTWMYNKDATPDIVHSSFRLSIRAALVRTEVLKSCFYSSAYTDINMTGIALGYKILKQGGIIRYHPGLVKQQHLCPAVCLHDEWVFSKEFFNPKWQIWILLNKKGFFRNLSEWYSSKNIGQQKLELKLHSSKEKFSDVRPASVSVLAPTLNRYSYLLNELEQLSRQTILPSEVLITDQTDEKDRRKPDFAIFDNLNIRYFPQTEKGQCIAWNKLLEEATGEYVLFLGDDADNIRPDFIEKLLGTQQRFNADMVAAIVEEAGVTYQPGNDYYYLSDTFPIALVRRKLLIDAGLFDMFFNRNIRADHDIAMRCHLLGALMIFDSSARIYHHRAPVGGLRTHNARVVSTSMAKKSISKFLNPTSSEIYLARKYYTPLQATNYLKIKYLNQLFISGNFLEKFLRLLFFAGSLPLFYKRYKKNNSLATQALSNNSKYQNSSVSVPRL